MQIAQYLKRAAAAVRKQTGSGKYARAAYELRVERQARALQEEDKRKQTARELHLDTVRQKTAERSELKQEIAQRHSVNPQRVVLMAPLGVYRLARAGKWRQHPLPLYIIKHRNGRNETFTYGAS